MSTSTKRTSLKDATSRPPVSSQRPTMNVPSWLRQLNPRQSADDLINPVFWRDVALEFLVCMLVECCVIWVLTTLRQEMYQPSTTHIGLFAGFLVYAIIEGYGPVTGAPVNPACCWGFFLAGRMSAARSNYTAQKHSLLFTVQEIKAYFTNFSFGRRRIRRSDFVTSQHIRNL